ncbi:DMT family transporter [Salibacterium halotolerans]|uniref:Small multidrug resistance pump n=1 Tax=Salibacterium halotolerans TaxID=1884432 RepID=A0A1I5LI88_9BACI|nr:multidrug efflux SMR transporter [Salibacterium halotolerans]SFO96893.1 small multidrug resistance pump [Salibacterium halotolerans]
MGYTFLAVSLIFAVIGNISVKLSDGFRRRLPSAGVFLFYIFCIYFLTISVQKIEISTAYAIWSGMTIAATTLLGIVFFQESADKRKLSSIACIILGVLLLHFPH